jgi:hypothetical protein
MASLQDYVTQQFPHHDITVLEPHDPVDLQLTDNTVVSYVVGSRAGIDLLNTFHRSVPADRVAAIEVKPSDPTVMPTAHEDSDGVVDLPVRRVAVHIAIGFVSLGVLWLVVTLLVADSATTAFIAAGFAAVVGGFIGAIVGGSRLAGQRANSQPRAPGQCITVVAAFLEDEDSAATLAECVGPEAEYEVRIVDRRGGWRSPGRSS